MNIVYFSPKIRIKYYLNLHPKINAKATIPIEISPKNNMSITLSHRLEHCFFNVFYTLKGIDIEVFNTVVFK